mgnify:CR=1 FL=1
MLHIVVTSHHEKNSMEIQTRTKQSGLIWLLQVHIVCLSVCSIYRSYKTSPIMRDDVKKLPRSNDHATLYRMI